MFRQTPDESQDKAHLDALLYRLPSKEIKRYISALHSRERSAIRLLTELCILGFMFSKFLRPGDIFGSWRISHVAKVLYQACTLQVR